MWPLILSLVCVGLILILVEVFVPGLIVGLMGLTSLIAATILCYVHYGPDAGNKLLIGELLVGILFVAWWLKYLPRTRVARHWTLKETVSGSVEGVPADSLATPLLHQRGVAITQLRPAGLALIEDERLHVVTAGELVDSGEPIVVVKVEGTRVVVQRSVPEAPVSA